MSKKTTNATVNTSFVAMNKKDLATIKTFCNSVKMNYNAKCDKYDFEKVAKIQKESKDIKSFNKAMKEASLDNVLLANYGNSDLICHTVSIWYAPTRFDDFAVRIEKDTHSNYSKSVSNKTLFESTKNDYIAYSTKQDEYRYSFKSLKEALTFFKTVLANYQKEVHKTKEATKEVKEATKEA